MNQHRSFTERYIEALNAFNSCEDKPSIEIINELRQSSMMLEEYSLLNVTSVCDLLGSVTEDLDSELVSGISAVITELTVLSHLAMGSRNKTDLLLAEEANT